MKENPEFLKILLNIEILEVLGNNHVTTGTLKHNKEKIREIITGIAWNHIKGGDLEMSEYISKVINKPIIKIVHEAGIRPLLFDHEEGINNIFDTLGISKDDIDNSALIKSAANLISFGYGFTQLSGLPYLVSPQSCDQKIIDEIDTLLEQKRKIEINKDYKHGTENLLRLINFLKESVFTKESTFIAA